VIYGVQLGLLNYVLLSLLTKWFIFAAVVIVMTLYVPQQHKR